MRAILVLVGLAAVVLVVLMSFGMVSIEQTGNATLPTVKLEGGKAPAFKTDVGDIDLTTSNTTIRLPTIEMKNATVELPVIEVEKAQNVQAEKR